MSYISAVHREDEVHVWERDEHGERIITTYPAPYYFYHDDPNGQYTTIFGTKVARVEYQTRAQYREGKKEFESEGIRTWESDISPELRVLSNHYYGIAAPKQHVTFLDIEVDYDKDRDLTVMEMVSIDPYAPINSVALLHEWKKTIVVLVVPPEEGWDNARLKHEVETVAPEAPIDPQYKMEYVVCEDERELLINLLAEFEDSDVLCGWNSDFFDIPYIAQRVSRVLDGQNFSLATREEIGRNNKPTFVYEESPNPTINKQGKCRWLKKLDFPKFGRPTFRPVTSPAGKLMGNTLDLEGRVRLDYMNLVKKYEPGERPSYKLAAVSDEVLVDDKTKQPTLPKLEYEGSLADLYRSNFAFFVRYNIRDTEILNGFEQKLGYVELANQMCHLSTALYSHVNGTLKLAELALINYCHHTLRRVVKNTTEPDEDRAIDGALVLLPQVDMHEWFGSIDINSLYPSAIRSLNISPETIRGQFTNRAADAAEIAAGSFKELTFVLESDGSILKKTAADWRTWLKERKWAVSGYGTAFDQTTQGFIPALLAEWYSMRKKYQKMKSDALDAGDYEKAGYYDRLQYVYKIKLNSLYGALTNLYFRFYDLRMGESTTGTGRMILKHQCRTVNAQLEGSYDVDFPLYDTIKDAMESGYTLEEAQQISLKPTVINGKMYPTKFDGRFQSDCVIYGDTDSTYFKTYADNKTDAIKIADAIAAKVNASYPAFMRETFLCNDGFDNIIKAGREIVSPRGIFVEKKRYIIWVVDLDGKSVDKMKVMGLDTKKTTLPQHVSKELNHFIERYLKGEDWTAISQTIVDYKDKLAASEDITMIGLPKGVKGVDEYTRLYENEGVGARLPGHVAASIHYNECLKKFGDKLSPRITSGTKIKVFYLKGNHGKFKSIALPTDIEVVPRWFLDHYIVDIEAHIERLVDNPLSNILKAIGKEPPTKQSMLTDSLLVF